MKKSSIVRPRTDSPWPRPSASSSSGAEGIMIALSGGRLTGAEASNSELEVFTTRAVNSAVLYYLKIVSRNQLFAIDYFTDDGGRTPMEEYLAALTIKMRAKTLRSIQLLKEFGPDLREPNTKPLGDGIFELRTNQGGIAGRCLFFFFDGNAIVLTHGFLKKTQKTPREEIDRAKRYRNEYMRTKRTAMQ